MKLFNEHIAEIKELCSKHKVKSLFVFGSVLNNSFNEESDVDLIVDIDSNDPIDYADNYFDLKFELQKIFNKEIDLLEQKSLKNLILKKEIEKTKVLLYG